ncbi:DNA-binding transcriptional regulator, MurR/RpiR family, contains HTH and SIS domains [Paracoccus alcaliphilus]|uniref:DNA-binding transcriptional regulator, MurR/RpiR family, contains HTH and SIS domains n=1 Tax=Paracoccus alcaliphilus TaxID=34002 RepID=A0A1H8F0N9_9RHOB|nr:MurR/RpiR family transcriptional regulator [Paracoccus alcaliphilus]WCR20077.1 MurR/RpiR family transcriptional regulator [Paracoccus alcaliphilus]SEN24954.1 DNA-binding transcriptional regulator, MurR/RpiR family, contains HTH and SIS domains [Paracoccus alcaliphilus]
MKIEERMRASLGRLTRAERQAATHILSHFPMSALGSITALARAAEVSSPTIVRLVQKLGFRGYSDYQAVLRAEVERLLVAPLSLPEGAREPQSHPIQSFAAQVVGNIEATLGHIPAQDFNGAAALLADTARRVAVMGGRLTHAHADYMATLLRVIRPDVSYLSDHLTDWQQALLDMRAGDVVVIFDIRRYEASAVHLAELATGQGAEVVLITDRWLSPAATHARHTLPCQIGMPAAWDSTATLMVVVEALLAQVQGHLADQVQERLNQLEDVFARTGVFRAPRVGARN